VDAYAEHPDQIDLSPYAYVGNNPIIKTDPDGNCPCGPYFITAVPDTPLHRAMDWTADQMGLTTDKDIKNLFDSKASIGERLASFGTVLKTIASILVGDEGVEHATTVKPSEVPTSPVVEVPTSESLQQRINDIHNAQPDIKARDKSTTAVAEMKKGEIVVASSRKYLTKEQRAALKPNEAEVTGNGHAEATIVDYSIASGNDINKIFTSRPVCENCYMKITKTDPNIKIGTQQKKQ
jgi:hypothetical protein